MTITVGSGVHVSSSNLSAPFIGTATSVGTTATVTYTVPATDGGVPIQYYVATSSPGNLTGTANQAGSGSVAVSGLTLSQPYTFTVQAYNWFGLSPASTSSNTITPAIAPCAPFIGTATAAGGTSVTVSYTAPTFNGGAAITSYVAASSPGSITATLSQAGSGTITVTGLTQGTPYSFSVRAVNRIGPSVASTQSNTITLFSVPCAPTIGTAVATGQTSATVAFTAPANNGGSAITKYIATSSPGSITATLSQAGSGTITVTGLTGLTTYTFKITATSSIGTGPASSPSSCVTTWRSPGSCAMTMPGVYTFHVPTGVYSVSAVLVGGGGGGVGRGAIAYASPGANYAYSKGTAGAGGGLAYSNNISVTPLAAYTVVVGRAGTGYGGYYCQYSHTGGCTYSTVQTYASGGDSYICFPSGTVKASGAALSIYGICSNYQAAYYVPGTYSGPCTSGSTGGSGSNSNCLNICRGCISMGGGGAAGYTGQGGNGGLATYHFNFGGYSTNFSCGTSGSGGGGGGGGAVVDRTQGYPFPSWTGNGGGVGICGQGGNGAGGVYCYTNHTGNIVINGHGGSGGSNGSTHGGCYGGGGGVYGYCVYSNGYNGGHGAVRIVWPGSIRQFPSTCVGSP